METGTNTIRDVQLLQLSLMKKIHNFCERYNIKYIMLSGTLLGAVRHKGFIPWDDDLDIGVLRPDYEKLLKLLTEHPMEGCFLQTFQTDKHYTLPFAKLRIDGTMYIESYWKNIDMHQGIFIDIFPLDKIKMPGSLGTELRRILAKEITYSIWRKEKCKLVRKGFKKIEVVFSSFIGLLPKKFLIFLQNALVIRERKSWEYVSSMFTSNYTTKKVWYKRSDFEHLKLFDFEDTQLYGPSNDDEALRRLFKNYMELPPEEKRSSGHDVVELSVQID